MRLWLSIISGLWVSAGLADSFAMHEIPMETRGARTFYVQSTIQGGGKSMLLIDTGSGHSVINEETLASLKSSGEAKFLKNIRGVMADGSTKIVPLYRISAITLGDNCVINNVDAAVLSNGTRQILGISALQKAAPFGLSFNPPVLKLNCKSADAQTASEEVFDAIKTPTEKPTKTEYKTPIQTQALVSAS